MSCQTLTPSPYTYTHSSRVMGIVKPKFIKDNFTEYFKPNYFEFLYKLLKILFLNKVIIFTALSQTFHYILWFSLLFQ